MSSAPATTSSSLSSLSKSNKGLTSMATARNKLKVKLKYSTGMVRSPGSSGVVKKVKSPVGSAKVLAGNAKSPAGSDNSSSARTVTGKSITPSTTSPKTAGTAGSSGGSVTTKFSGKQTAKPGGSVSGETKKGVAGKVTKKNKKLKVKIGVGKSTSVHNGQFTVSTWQHKNHQATPSLLEEVLNEKKMALLKSPEVIEHLKSIQEQVRIDRQTAPTVLPKVSPKGRFQTKDVKPKKR